MVKKGKLVFLGYDVVTNVVTYQRPNRHKGSFKGTPAEFFSKYNLSYNSAYNDSVTIQRNDSFIKSLLSDDNIILYEQLLTDNDAI